jgi:hypothetical protein
VKLEATEAKLTEMKIRLKKIMDSQLLIVQKIDAMKTFVLPMLDFIMLNGDIGEMALMKMDKYIRGRVDELLKVRGLPIECHHASWKDGGLSYPSLIDRRRVLMIKSFTQMVTSKDEKVKKAMRWFTESERIYRIIEQDRNAQFLNWEKLERRRGTASIIARTKNTCYKLGISLKMNDDEMIIKSGESELKTKIATGIGRFLTQKLVRSKKYEKLIQHPVHEMSSTTLKDSATSNAMLTDIYTRRSDAFFRFTVVGRADCLPTPANLRRWFNDRGNEDCPRCDKGRKQTLAHILNECTPNYNLMTKRHNRLAEVTRRAVVKFIGRYLQSEIRENQRANQAGLPEELKTLRPDMMFRQRDRSTRRDRGEGQGEDREQNITEIIEFSCPYSCISHDRDTLEKTYETKRTKYEELARTLSTIRNEKVRVMPIIVSSIRAIYGPSMKDLQKVLRCSNNEMKKLERKMSETVIFGSWEIWRNNAKHMERGNREEVNQLIAEEERSVEEAEAELQRERARENGENRIQMDQEEEWMNGAEGDVEDYEDEEEEEGEESESRQERQGIQEEGEREAGTKMGRRLRRTDKETGEDTDAEAETGTILGTTRDVADDEDNGQDSE